MFTINDTKMLFDAKISFPPYKKFSMGLEVIIFLLVSAISTLPQSILTSLIIAFFMIRDPAFIELISSGNFSEDAILEYQLEFTANMPSSVYVVMLLSSGFMILAAIIYCKKFQKRKLYTIGFVKTDAAKEYLMGTAIGLVMISIPAFVCLATGFISLNISKSFDPIMIVLFFIAFLIQGMGEEALFRGYLMTTLARGTKTWTAIFVSSLMFSLFHISNQGFGIISFINIFLFGVFAAVFMLKRGSIWGVGAIHSIWNFVQGNIFGFSVSGNPKFDSIFQVSSSRSASVISGGDFGLEGGLAVTIILLVAIFFSLKMPTKESEYVSIHSYSVNNN